MTYCISDVHGCYEKYVQMLEKINFSDNDILYVLGDVVDWGEKPITLLQDMSLRSNVIPIIGNHDAMAFDIFKLLSAEFKKKNVQEYFDGNLEDFFEYINPWVAIGGQTTLDEFKRLSKDKKEDIIDYLSEFSLYETVSVGGKNFILTHSGVPQDAVSNRSRIFHDFNPNNLDSYNLVDFLQVQVDYNKQYFKDAFLITGHLPTFLIDENSRGKIYRRNNNIAIDTGVGFGENFGCICLETDEELYT